MPATPKSAKKSRTLEQIARSKAGLFLMDPAALTVEPGFNHRIRWGNLKALADDIEANGLDQPLKIRKVEGSEITYIVAGHRRHRAITTILIPQGRWKDPETPKQNRSVQCFSEARFTNITDRLFSQIAGNTGLPYTLLEKARVYQDILSQEPIIKPADLARRSGETKQAVSDALRLVRDGTPSLITAVENESLAASTAIAIIKQATSPEEQETLLADAIANAHTANRSQIKPKDIPKTPAPTEETAAPQSKTPDSSSSGNSPDPEPYAFQLYSIQGAPENALPDGTYHETERLVLFPLPGGGERLHLLTALTSEGEPCYGYRYNNVTQLPNPEESSSYAALPEEGFPVTLNRIAAFASIFDSAADPASRDAIETALFDALCRYYPEAGNPEEPLLLEFVAIPDAPSESDFTTGYQGIINSPSTDRTGSSGPGSGGFVSVDKRLKEIEGTMEKLADLKDEAKSPERITTAEILLQVLRNEMSLSTLSDHLKGKS